MNQEEIASRLGEIYQIVRTSEKESITKAQGETESKKEENHFLFYHCAFQIFVFFIFFSIA